MTHNKSILINTRFFAAIEALLLTGRLDSKAQFCDKYGIDRGNFSRLSRYPHLAFELAFLSYIVEDFNVNPEWILTGNGSMFSNKKALKSIQSS